ncbi:SH3 domain-containing protein [Treponema sp.]|uniref:SH3 domain-containing protein n=1 Tax=Treponema sp. TaxID=166 RepID=UPI00298DE010|nr:SH3 domain-containing protein [Treponema sp.]MCQ2241564.1 SH3 domain-containing protein [Treponema sp.]
MKKLIKTALLMAFVLALGSCKKESVESSVAEDSPEEFLEDVEDDAEEITEEKDVEKELPEVDMEYVMVNSPEGLNVRETPDLSSMKVAGLTDRTIVRLLQTGTEITIDDITSSWLEIELPSDIAEKKKVKSGWVFGGYMERNLGENISSDYYHYGILDQPRMASIGSYIMPHENRTLVMYSAPSEKSKKISSFGGKDSGIVIRVAGVSRYLDDGAWYYILNQSTGKKGWVFGRTPGYSTADGFKISKTKTHYIRKNADVLVEKNDYKASLGYIPRIVLCSDNIHYVARVNESKNLEIYNRNSDEVKNVYLSAYLNDYNDRESDAIFYSAKSNAVYFGWGKSVCLYSMDEGNISTVFEIDTDAPEALSGSVVIESISVSKDERYFYLVGEFFTGKRYISRMIAFDAETKVQKILDVETPNCDSDHHLEYDYDVDFDENNNAVYHICNSIWTSSTHIVENALVYVSSNSENWPDPVVHMLPETQFSERTLFIPGSEDVLCCDSRFCVYDPDANLKASYRLANNEIYEGMRTYNNFQMNEDKSICAVLEGTLDKYITFYSTKTFNLLFAMKLESVPGSDMKFWWNGKMLLVSEKVNENHFYSSYDITITEKENQISDTEPLVKEQVGLCAKTFNCEDDGEVGYGFNFSPDGIYMCYDFDTRAENAELVRAIIGGYEITGNNEVHLYPYFSEFRLPYYSWISEDFSNFRRFNLLPEQKGLEVSIKVKFPRYNRFGEIYLYDKNKNFIGSTYDWDIGYGAYGVQNEAAASVYQVYEK